MTQTWQVDWYRLTAVDAIAEGQGALAHVAGATVVARRHLGAIHAHREACPGCGASLLDASIHASGASLTCSACGATHDLEGTGTEDGPLRLPVMLVDQIAYVFIPSVSETEPDGV